MIIDNIRINVHDLKEDRREPPKSNRSSYSQAFVDFS